MNDTMTLVNQGWLLKSPPEQKLRKVFKSVGLLVIGNIRFRYFCLFAQSDYKFQIINASFLICSKTFVKISLLCTSYVCGFYVVLEYEID